MRKVILLAGAAVAVLAAAVGAFVATAGATKSGRSHEVQLSKLSAAELATLSDVNARGTPFPLPATDIRTKRLEAAGYGAVTLLDTHEGHNFFRIATSGSHDCYGIGKAGAAWPLSDVSCRAAAPYFPSPDEPLLDDSIVGADSSTESVHFLRVEGFAADGVSAIRVLDSSGKLLSTVPVDENVYDSGPSGVAAGAARIEAVDAVGNVLATVPTG